MAWALAWPGSFPRCSLAAGLRTTGLAQVCGSFPHASVYLVYKLGLRGHLSSSEAMSAIFLEEELNAFGLAASRSRSSSLLGLHALLPHRDEGWKPGLCLMCSGSVLVTCPHGRKPSTHLEPTRCLAWGPCPLRASKSTGDPWVRSCAVLVWIIWGAGVRAQDWLFKWCISQVPKAILDFAMPAGIRESPEWCVGAGKE